MDLCDENEIESEGIINNIPKSINISNKFASEKRPKSVHFRVNSLDLNKNIFLNKLSDKEFQSDDDLNRTIKIQSSKYNFKIEDNNSTASKSSSEDKLKKVTFSTVQIIRVANYKKYNKVNTIKRNENNNSNQSDEEKCIVF